MTIWLSDDEEIDLLEYYELLKEARTAVDRKYPRRDSIQSSWLFAKTYCDRDFARRWGEIHFLMFDLRKETDEWKQ